MKRNSARSEILVNRALLQDSENELTAHSQLQLPTSTALPIQTPTYHPLTENGLLVAQNNVTLAQQEERGQYQPSNPFVNTQPAQQVQQGPATRNTAPNGTQPQNGMAILTCYYCGGANHTQHFCMLYNRHFGIYSGNQNRRRYNNDNGNRGRTYDANRDGRRYNNSNNRSDNTQRQNNSSYQDFQNRDQDFQNRN